jgi:hypothetical protein
LVRRDRNSRVCQSISISGFIFCVLST